MAEIKPEFGVFEEDEPGTGALEAVHHRGEALSSFHRDEQVRVVRHELRFKQPNPHSHRSVNEEPFDSVVDLTFESRFATL